MTITEFILARITEKEDGASGYHRVLCMRTACDADDCIWGADEQGAMERERVCTCGYPIRVLAECEAMRTLVAEFDFDGPVVDGWTADCRRVLRVLAAIWSDHADYEEGWR